MGQLLRRTLLELVGIGLLALLRNYYLVLRSHYRSDYLVVAAWDVLRVKDDFEGAVGEDKDLRADGALQWYVRRGSRGERIESRGAAGLMARSTQPASLYNHRNHERTPERTPEPTAKPGDLLHKDTAGVKSSQVKPGDLLHKDTAGGSK